MAKRSFLITAVMKLKGPNNVKQIVDQINAQLAGVKVNVSVAIPPTTVTQIQKVSTGLKQVSVSAKKAENDLERFGAQIARSIERYGAFTVATTGFIALIGKISSGIGETIKFQRELVRIAQVSGQTTGNLKGLADEVTRLSKAYGVASNTILESAVTLSQAGLSAKDVKVALESLAQTGVASTFGNIKDTTEASIAAMQQFGYETKDLGRLLSSINKVSAQFAVESDDITIALRRAGGAFKSAGGNIDEFNALFTTVRQTTRESAETISTGLRTITARLQRPKTQNFLKSLGIDVLNDKNQFVGGYEAIKRISQALKDIPSTDVRYARIAEEVAGIRQISKFIPLIEKFDVAQKALNVSTRGGTSLSEDAAKAQGAWAIQIEKVNQSFQELLRTIGNNKTIQTIAQSALSLADAFLKVASSLESILPYVAIFSGARIFSGINKVSSGFGKEIFKGRGFATGGPIQKYASGGHAQRVPGIGNSDTVKALLTPGEYVLSKSMVSKIGIDTLNGIKNGQIPVHKFGKSPSIPTSKLDSASYLQKEKLTRRRGLNQSYTEADLLQAMLQIEPAALRGTFVGFRELRKQFPSLGKKQFDSIALKASQSGLISLHGHDFPTSLSKVERDEMVFGGKNENSRSSLGDFFVGGNIRKYARGGGVYKGSFEYATDIDYAPAKRRGEYGQSLTLDEYGIIEERRRRRLKRRQELLDLENKPSPTRASSHTDGLQGYGTVKPPKSRQQISDEYRSLYLGEDFSEADKERHARIGAPKTKLGQFRQYSSNPNVTFTKVPRVSGNTSSNPPTNGPNGPNNPSNGPTRTRGRGFLGNIPEEGKTLVNPLNALLLLSVMDGLTKSTGKADSAISKVTEGLLSFGGQLVILNQLFKGIGNAGQKFGEDPRFGSTFSKAGVAGRSATRSTYRESRGELIDVHAGSQFGLKGGDFRKATTSDLAKGIQLNKKEKSEAIDKYLINKIYSKQGGLNGKSHSDALAEIRSDPDANREYNKAKRSLKDKSINKAIEQAQLEKFESTFGKGAGPNEVRKKLRKGIISSEQFKSDSTQAREYANRKGEFVRQEERARRNKIGRFSVTQDAANIGGALLAAGASTAGSYIRSNADKQIQSGKDATRQSATGSALSAGGTAAGIGLTAGFAVGGPVGAAIGAAALGIPTAIYAFTTGLEEAKNALQKVKFDEAFEKISKKIQKVSVGQLGGTAAASQNNQFFKDVEKQLGSGSVDVRTNITSQIKNSADGFEILFGKIADSSKTVEEFDKIVGSSLQTFSRVSDIPYEELRKKIEDQIKANEKLSVFNNRVADAFREQSIRINSINDLLGAVATVGVRQSDSSQSLDRIYGFSGSGSQSQTLSSRGGLIDFAKDGRGDLAAFSKLIKNVSNTVGGPSKQVGQEAVFASQLAKELPNILLKLQGADPLSNSGTILDQLGGELDNIARKVGYGGNELQRAIISAAAEIVGTSEDEGKLLQEIDRDLSGTVSRLSSGLGQSSDVFKELINIIGTNNEKLREGFGRYYEVVGKTTDLELKRQGLFSSAFQTRNSFLDRDTPLGFKLGAANRRTATISGLADNSVGGLSGTITRSQGNISKLDEAIKVNLGGKNQVQLEALRAKEVDTLTRASAALEDLATNSDKLSAIQEEIGKEQNKNKLKKEGLDTLVFGNKGQQKELAKGILLTTFAQKNKQGLGAVPQNLRGNVLDFIDKAGEGDINGEKAKDLKKRLTKGAGIEAGVQPNIAEQITSGITPAIEALIKKFDEQVKLQGEAINAQKQINNTTGEQLKTALVDANKAFLDGLQKVFDSQLAERKKTENLSTQGNINKIQAQIGIRDNLSRGVVGGINIGVKNKESLTGAIPELENLNNLRKARGTLLGKNKSVSDALGEVKDNGNGFAKISDLLKAIDKIEKDTGIYLDKPKKDLNQLKDQGFENYNLDIAKKSVRGIVNQSIGDKLIENNKSIDDSSTKIKEFGVNVGTLPSDFEKLNLLVKKLNESLTDLNGIENPRQLESKLQFEQAKLNKPGFATGGRVPGSGIGDSVPAMLTPGEFVLKKSAVEAIGLENLYEMNNIQKFASGGKVKDRISARQTYLNKLISRRDARLNKVKAGFANKKYAPRYSGKIGYNFTPALFGDRGASGTSSISHNQYLNETSYTPTRKIATPKFRSGAGFNYRSGRRYAEGGEVTGNTGFDGSFLGRFDSVVKSFTGSVDRLVNSLQSLNGMSITMNANHKVEVIFNGAETLTRLQPEILDIAMTTAKKAINDMIDSKFPDVGRV